MPLMCALFITSLLPTSTHVIHIHTSGMMDLSSSLFPISFLHIDSFCLVLIVLDYHTTFDFDQHSGHHHFSAVARRRWRAKNGFKKDIVRVAGRSRESLFGWGGVRPEARVWYSDAAAAHRAVHRGTRQVTWNAEPLCPNCIEDMCTRGQRTNIRFTCNTVAPAAKEVLLNLLTTGLDVEYQREI